jgi:hypothetical protein
MPALGLVDLRGAAQGADDVDAVTAPSAPDIANRSGELLEVLGCRIVVGHPVDHDGGVSRSAFDRCH